MKVINIAQKIKKDNIDKFGKMNEKKIALIIRKALVEIKNELEEADLVRVPGLGSFKTRMINQKKEGEIVTVKRIIFKKEQEKK